MSRMAAELLKKVLGLNGEVEMIRIEGLTNDKDCETAIVAGASRGVGGGLVEALLKRGDDGAANSRGIV